MATVRKSPIVGLIQFLAAVVVIWFAITEGWPWLRAKLDGESGASASSAAGGDGAAASSEAGRCLDAAEAASETVAGTLRAFRSPPYDQAAWGSASLEIASALGRADTACLCGHPACPEAGAAVAALRELHSMADGMVQGRGGGNIAVLRERSDEHLDRARDLWRAGG